MHSANTDPLLQPFTLRNLTLRNRLVSTSHEPAYSEDGLPTDRYRLYHVEKARGGLALTMIGGSAVVSPDSPAVFGNLLLYKDEIVPWLRRLVDDVHAEGAAVMCQVTHLGRRTSNYAGDWLPAVYSSAAREAAHRTFPKVAEEWDLDRIVDDYVAAAQRCKESGLDGIELQHYGHLLDGFLSPAMNSLPPPWGGSFENRLRFPLRVIGAIRKAVGPDYIIGIRMSLDECMPGGLTYAEGIAALRAYGEAGIDFVSVIKGHIDTDASLAKVIPGMGTPSAPFLDFAGQVKRDGGVPVMYASRIQDVATARHAVREELVDLVGMTRPHLADPYIVQKITNGEEDRIRPCVGANFCLDAIYDSGSAKCVHNPATGREGQFPQKITRRAERARKIVVVGAGPAGLEAARVLGERGHKVVVLEANSLAGGQVRLAAASPRRRELIGIVDWRVSELAHFDAEVRYNTYAERDDILSENPDVVIIASGGIPNTSFLAAGGELVHTTWDVLGGGPQLGGDVLLYDDNGGYPGMDAAEVLAGNGAKVRFVTPERAIAPDVGGMNSPAYLKVFAEHEVDTLLAHRLVSVERADGGKVRANLYSEYAELETRCVVDHVVVEHGTLPNDELYFSLIDDSTNRGEVDYDALLRQRPQQVLRNPDGHFQLFRIGDAISSRNIHASMLGAMRLCLPI